MSVSADPGPCQESRVPSAHGQGQVGSKSGSPRQDLDGRDFRGDTLTKLP